MGGPATLMTMQPAALASDPQLLAAAIVPPYAIWPAPAVADYPSPIGLPVTCRKSRPVRRKPHQPSDAESRYDSLGRSGTEEPLTNPIALDDVPKRLVLIKPNAASAGESTSPYPPFAEQGPCCLRCSA